MTDPGLAVYPPTRGGYRRAEITCRLGYGETTWTRASETLMGWGVKTRSGFRVDPPQPVTVGDRPIITVRVAGLRIHEPVEVTAVIRTSDRVDFDYRTFPGHPVSGEDAFILHRDNGGTWRTVRSLTRPATQLPWKALYRMLLVAQKIAPAGTCAPSRRSPPQFAVTLADRGPS